MKITDSMIEKSLDKIKNKRVRARLNKAWDSILLSELKTKKFMKNARSSVVKNYLGENDSKTLKIRERTFVLIQDADRDINLFRLQFLKEIHSKIIK